ncbi:hypothetical protein ES703_14693 [subsurface metagenome]
MDLEANLYEAETKAWRSLAHYKFMMFGYWAAIWVHLNRIGEFNKPNPFLPLVDLADSIVSERVKQASNLLKKAG